MRLRHRDRCASVTRHRRNTPFVRAAAMSSFRGHINRLITLGLESTRTYSGSVTILTLIPSFIFFFVLLILFVVLRKATLSGKQRPARLRVLPVIIIIVKLRELLILNNHDKAIRRKLGQPHLNQCITAIPNNNYYYWRIEGGGDILIQVRLLNSAPFSSLLYPRHPRTNHRVAVSHSPRPLLPVFTNDPNQT